MTYGDGRAELIENTRWMRPRVRGVVCSIDTAWPPNEWPVIVTLPGSPPNWVMLRLTHWSAATMSSMPQLPDVPRVPSALSSRDAYAPMTPSR